MIDLRSRLALWAAVAASAELMLLRIATRTFIHIPGMDVVSGPLAVIAEAGRLAFHLTIVLVVALLFSTLVEIRRDRTGGSAALAAAIGLVLVASGLAVAGQLSPSVTGWISLFAIGLPLVATRRLGERAVPLILWVAAVWLTGSGTLLQGSGGGIGGGQFGGLLLAGEFAGVTAAVTLPLLTARPFPRPALTAGLAVAGLVTALLSFASSTTAILVLWSFGIPASLSPLLYGLAAGAAVMTLWAAFSTGRRELGAGILLLAIGGFGLISTYQTILIVAGLVIVAMAATGPRSRSLVFAAA